MRVRGSATETTADAYTDRVLRAIGRRVHSLATVWDETATLAPPEGELARAILDLPPLAPADSALGDEIGPFYDTAGVMKLLGGVTKQAVEARRRKSTILALRTSDGKWVYPSFQFDGADVSRPLVPAIRAFRDSPPWSAALWFVTGNDDLDGKTPLDWAKAELPPGSIATSAQRTAAEWV